MESLTYCQAHRTRVAVRMVRWHTAGPGMKSLTRYQANRTRMTVRSADGTQLDLAWSDLLAVKPIEPGWQ